MIGNSGRPRIFAFILDNLLATVSAFLLVAALKSDSPYVGVGALCLTYLAYFFLSEALWSRRLCIPRPRRRAGRARPETDVRGVGESSIIEDWGVYESSTFDD